MYPIFVFAVLLVSKHAHSRQRKTTPTPTAVSCQVYVAYMPHEFSIYIEQWFSTYFLPRTTWKFYVNHAYQQNLLLKNSIIHLHYYYHFTL